MKKKLGFIMLISLMILSFVFININKTGYGVAKEKDNIKINLKFKGLSGARDFVEDEKNNFYIAFKNKIIVIEENGKSYKLFSDNNLDITSIDYKDDIIYFASKGKIMAFNNLTKETEECVTEIPNVGDYTDMDIKIKDKYIFISIGAATNSGVVGNDNEWIKEYPMERDHSSQKLILNGTNFGEYNTGAFREKGKESFKDQIIEKDEIGNSSVLIYNIESKAYETFAWGIRNITGFDFSSKEKLYAIVGGMEDRGERPVKNDVDYIYEINKSEWYGFPDYSGGDPISSPRFQDEGGKTQNFVLQKHPRTKIEAPVYQHDKVSALKNIAIDKDGKLGEKDDMFFYDSVEKIIYSGGVQKSPKKFVSLGNKSDIKSIKFSKDGLKILESSQGNIYEIKKENGEMNALNVNRFWGYIATLIITVAVVIIVIFIKNKNIKCK